MRVTINGKTVELKRGTDLESMLHDYKANLEAVVVELNQKILKKSAWKNTILRGNDIVELISFIGGG